MRPTVRIAAAAVLAAGMGVAAPGSAPAATSVNVTERVSVGDLGTQADSYTYFPSISRSGRSVAFESFASNLVAGDTNGARDVFVRDRTAKTTERVSVATGGGQANSLSIQPSISDDGRYVAFTSAASNLVAGDANGRYDVFVRDRQAGVTEVVSLDSSGNFGDGDSTDPSISADGRYVAFVSRAKLVPDKSHHRSDVFVHDRDTGQTTRVSVDSSGVQGDGSSSASAISSDGRFVTFGSLAPNLVVGDTNGAGDIFVRDRTTGTTTRASVSSSGAQGNGASEYPAISSDGRVVTFESLASNLVSGDSNGERDAFVRFSSKPPATPTLVAPEDEGRFDLGEDQVFTVRSVDPEGDAYRGVITVVDAMSGATVATFSTATVPSGNAASGQPTTPLSPGEYRWSAVAVDEFGATSDRSAEQVFGVVVQPNRTPSVPTLVDPDDGHVFQFGLPERFAVNAVDADGDLYRGLVTITNVTTGEITEFHTRLVPSGTDSSGRPVAPLVPGDYIWNAVAIDIHGAESDPSETRSFQVVAPSLVLF